MKEGATDKVVQSRSSSDGQLTVLEALRVFNPTSLDLPSNEKELTTYIERLRNEGYKPTVLKSKDVYRYRSYNTLVNPVVRLHRTPDIDAAQKVQNQKPDKRRCRKTLEKKTGINYALLSPAAKVVLKNQPKILLTNMSKESLKRTATPKPQAFATSTTQMPTCIRLTNISGPSRGHTARLQFHTGVWSGVAAVPNPHGCTTDARRSRRVNSVVRARSLDAALIGVPFSEGLQNGRVLKESNGMPCWRVQKRKWVEEAEDRHDVKKPRNGVWLVKTQEDSRVSFNNFLRFKVIKIDDSITDDEVRRKAQKILRVNLSPVIEIQPL